MYYYYACCIMKWKFPLPKHFITVLQIIQFVTGMIAVDDYIFVSYGINDCIGSVAKIDKSSAVKMLKNVSYPV